MLFCFCLLTTGYTQVLLKDMNEKSFGVQVQESRADNLLHIIFLALSGKWRQKWTVFRMGKVGKRTSGVLVWCGLSTRTTNVVFYVSLVRLQEF